ncbi:dienelactone hydrolase [Bosea caraganae]|uniref:Dienelactone hydrolase n=2 Tax=Bosea caraganae TaxID=2763117 RepID=A0A370L3A6_9HYPH|nr:dienelactone hydrolase [Bosea caraganae]RDJ22580.1 dienelactone hydrolase [Bosea caraganae]
MVGTADRSTAQSSIGVDRFGSAGSTVYLLHGSDGLTNASRYQFAAQTIANAGYTVLLPRYFEATGDSRARYGDIRAKFPTWLRTLESILSEPSPGTEPGRIGLVGFSLGGALALALATRSPRVRAVVDFFGFAPDGLGWGLKLPPTLILHGSSDRVVPVDNAASIERLIRSQGGTVESHIYPGDGHGLSLASWPDAIGRTQAFLQRHL